MVKPTKKSKESNQKPLPQEALELIDHIADILAEEFIKAIRKKDEKKGDGDEGSNLR